jgi:pilus assembly protein CpaB
MRVGELYEQVLRMTNVRAKLMLLGAVVMGLVSVLVIGNWLERRAASQPRQVLVAASAFKAGSRLTAKDLNVAELPSSRVPKGAFQDPRALDGRLLAQDVTAGAVFADAMLTPPGGVTGLAAVITPGMRAMTVRVNDVVGVAGFALPGNYVDILVNIPEKGVNDHLQKTISKAVLEKVLVLAVAQEASREAAAPKVVNAVTLQVSSEQAEKIDLARSIGTLSLVLRNQLDQQVSQTTGATEDTLLGKAPAPALKAGPAHAKRVIHRNCTPVLAGTRAVQDCW